MKLILQSVAVTALAVAIGLGVWITLDAREPAAPREAHAALAPAAPEPDAGADPASEREQTSQPPAELAPAEQQVVTGIAAKTAIVAALDGRVVDAENHPIASARAAESEHQPAAATTSLADGSLRLECELSSERE